MPSKATGRSSFWGAPKSYHEELLRLSGVLTIAASGHVLILKCDGTVIARGGLSESDIPDNLRDVIQISSGGSHSLALKADGTVVAWGSNLEGQCDVPPGLHDVKAISAGYYHSLALRSDGTVVAWGANSQGECDVPAGLSDVVDILASSQKSVAVRTDGSLISWGGNEYNLDSLGPTGPDDISAIAAGGWHGWSSLLLRSDGTVIAFGHQPPSDLRDVVAGSVGEEHSLVLKEDGSVVSWGFSAPPPDGLTGISAIAAGASHDLALRSDGTVIGWGGDPGQGGEPLPASLREVVAIDAGDFHSLALRQDGTVVAWGRNERGQCNVPPGLDRVVAIACGYYHNLALKGDGTIVAWGWNDDRQCEVPPGLDDVIAVAAGLFHSVALRSDGTVVSWGAEETRWGSPDPYAGLLTQIPAGMGKVSAIAAARYGTLALMDAINEPPQASLCSLSAVWNGSTSFPFFELHRACRDPEWDSFIISEIASVSVVGGQVERVGDILVYTPPKDFVGTDSFTYTIRDCRGATSEGTVQVSVSKSEPVCDLDEDGCVDRADLALLLTRIRANSNDLAYDLNGDRKLDIADARFLVLHFTNPGGLPSSP